MKRLNKQLGCLSLFVLCITSLYPAQASSEKPNIIWLMAEDISLDLACYGMAAVRTPNLDAMAARGSRFDHCYVTNPICSPSRSAMMMGTHQQVLNAGHHRSNRDVPLPEPYKPFTHWLRQAGYTCVLGHHAVFDNGMKTDVNFKSTAFGPWDGRTQFGLFDKKQKFEPEDQPFFAQIQLKVTHRGDWWDAIRSKSEHPVNPNEVILPPYFADTPEIRMDWAKYLDQIEYADNEVGMILEELEAKGMRDNTIIIFIGDNGRCNLRGKGYLHDPGLHIPLIIEGGPFNGGQVRKDVISATDITATILELAGVDIPDYMTGKSFINGATERNFVYGSRDTWDEILDKSRAITNGKWAYIRNDMPEVPFDAHQAYLDFYRPAVWIMRALHASGKLTPAQAFFFEDSKPQEELYDLEADPFQLNNLVDSPEYRNLLKDMRAEMAVFEKQMMPVHDTVNITHPDSVDVFQWIKEEKPELYEQMKAGVEIGFQHLAEEYKTTRK